MPRYCMLLSFQPGLPTLLPGGVQHPVDLGKPVGAGVSWRGNEFGSPALRPRYRPAPAGKMRAASRGKSALWAAAAATCRGLCGALRPAPDIHDHRGKRRLRQQRQAAQRAGGLDDATQSCWPETEPVQQKRAISMANNQRIYSRSAPAAMGKKWANSTKIARLATGKSTLPAVK